MRAYNTFMREGSLKAKMYENIDDLLKPKLQTLGLLGGVAIELILTPIVGVIALIEALAITIFNLLGTLIFNKKCASDLLGSVGALAFSGLYLAFSPLIGIINSIIIARGLCHPPTDDEGSYIQRLAEGYERRSNINFTWKQLQKNGLIGVACHCCSNKNSPDVDPDEESGAGDFPL